MQAVKGQPQLRAAHARMGKTDWKSVIASVYCAEYYESRGTGLWEEISRRPESQLLFLSGGGGGLMSLKR